MRLVIVITLVLGLVGCAVKPQPIDFGKDACVYCKMNIVDQQHAAELVTKKGKVFKYDAIECMLKDTQRNHNEVVSLYLVVDYLDPSGFIDATTAYYLVSEAIPSPMGEYLSAFSDESKTRALVKTDEDHVYNWTEINKVIK